jgi:hypothetical protein
LKFILFQILGRKVIFFLIYNFAESILI